LSARFAKSYIDHLFAERDLLGLYNLIEVLSREHSLPDEFWLFSRLLEWIPRSGVWQYYETLSDEDAERISKGLERFGYHQIAAIYLSGKDRWEDSVRMSNLDTWIDAHCSEIEAAAFGIIAGQRDALNF